MRLLFISLPNRHKLDRPHPAEALSWSEEGRNPRGKKEGWQGPVPAGFFGGAFSLFRSSLTPIEASVLRSFALAFPHELFSSLRGYAACPLVGSKAQRPRSRVAAPTRHVEHASPDLHSALTLSRPAAGDTGLTSQLSMQTSNHV